jgi:cell wall-associated NlpC family hydrolase
MDVYAQGGGQVPEPERLQVGDVITFQGHAAEIGDVTLK